MTRDQRYDQMYTSPFGDEPVHFTRRETCRCEIHKVVHVLDLLAKFVCKLEAHMADLTALKQAVADNAAATDAVVIKIDELKAAIANLPADNQPEVDAVVADLTATVERLKAAVA